MSKESIAQRLAALKNSKSENCITSSSPIITKPSKPTLTSATLKALSPAPNSLAAKLAARKVGGTLNIKKVESLVATDPTIPDPKLDSLLIKPKGIDELEDFDADVFLKKLPLLAQSIEEKAPAISTYLQEINKSLVQFQELAHILNEDQVAVVVSGLLFLTNTNMAEAVTKNGSRKVMKIDEVAALF